MREKVLFVDDEPNILDALARQLRKRFELRTALGGQQGLAVLHEEGPFAVVVADMKMPEMNGIEFLGEVMKRSPDSVRMMLTGNADQQTAIDAVNKGKIFRFNTKPCPTEILTDAIEAALQQYHLITAERVLLERTLAGSVKVLVDVLSLFDADAFVRTTRIRRWIATLAKQLEIGSPWELDVAAMLLPIGQMTLPPEITTKIRTGAAVTRSEQEQISRAPEIGRNLIANIPRLETVSNIVYYEDKGYDGSGFPADEIAGKDIPLGARLLKILKDLAEADKGESPSEAAFVELAAKASRYDPEILSKVRAHFLGGTAGTIGQAEESSAGKVAEIQVIVDQLRPNDKTVSQIVTASGVLVLSAGHVLGQSHIERLRSYHKTKRLKEPIHIVRVSPNQRA